MKEYSVYMLLCWDGGYYVGVTGNLEVRIAEHAIGIVRQCYTYIRRPVLLVYSGHFRSPEEAIAAEKRLKGWSRAKKRALIRGDWSAIEELSRGARLRNAAGEIVAHPSTSSG